MKAFQPVQDTVCLLAGVRPTRRTLPGEHLEITEAVEAEAHHTPTPTLWTRLAHAILKRPDKAAALTQPH